MQIEKILYKIKKTQKPIDEVSYQLHHFWLWATQNRAGRYVFMFQNNLLSGRTKTEIVPNITQRELGAMTCYGKVKRKEGRKNPH